MMVQQLIPLEQTGAKRTGSHSGGRRQKYFLDEPGRKLILAKYDGTTQSIDEIMRHFPGYPRQVIRRWAANMGLSRQKEPPWTEEEVVYLERFLHKKKLREIAKHLGRTVTAVKLKAKRLGVCKTAEGYTMRGLMLGLGISNHHRILMWIDKGWLKGTRRQTERTDGQGGDMWLFTDAAIRELVRNHPEEIDPRRAEWPWLVDVLLGGRDGLGPLKGNES